MEQQCIDFKPHVQNAIDRAFPFGKINSYTLAERWVEIHDEAIVEFNNCEGDHQ